MGSFAPNAIIILVALKGIGCSCRDALFQASIIVDLVLSVCVFAACSGKASAQSHDASSTGFTDYAMELGEDPLLKLRDMTSARYSAKALPEMIGELNRHLEVWANYYQRAHHRTTFRKVNRYVRRRLQRHPRWRSQGPRNAHHQTTFRKVNRYVRRRLQRHPRWRSQGPRYVTGPSLIGRNTALSGGPGRYPWKRDIITTIFWIGERPRGNNPVPNVRSSWDKHWYYSYGGYDNPDPGSRRDFIPIDFVPRQNPFYFALPYNDVEGGHSKHEASRVIPWFKQAFVRNGQTVLKDRWIAVQHGNKVCYAQWEDCGPFRTDDWRYVFGNERPRPNLNQGAGLDVSPAVRDYLGLGVKDACDWKFVEFREVPPGPWATYGDNNTFVILRRQSNKQFAAE